MFAHMYNQALQKQQCERERVPSERAVALLRVVVQRHSVHLVRRSSYPPQSASAHLDNGEPWIIF